jgi:hypothetical protein
MKPLGRYLTNHLAGAYAAEEIVRHGLRQPSSTAFREGLEAFRLELVEDRRELIRILGALGLRAGGLKLLWGRLAGRLEPVGINRAGLRITSYSLLLQLEALCVGVEGKRMLWAALGEIAATEPALARFDLTALGQRAVVQRKALERLRRRAARTALGPQRSGKTRSAPPPEGPWAQP